MTYSIEVFMDGRWYNWVYRKKFKKARHAKKQLRKGQDIHGYWDDVRIRWVYPGWLRL